MSQRLNYMELSPEAMAAMRSVEHSLNTASGLESGLLELVRLRASLMNGCEYCIGLHTHELKKHNETEARIASVEDWRNSDAYTQRERAALAWTEAVTNIHHGHASDEAFAAVREHFAEKELVDLTVAIAGINAWNRIAIAFRAEKRHTGAERSAAPAEDVPDDEGKVSVEG
jgi:AhpD family alkylhydroperoxidase